MVGARSQAVMKCQDSKLKGSGKHQAPSRSDQRYVFCETVARIADKFRLEFSVKVSAVVRDAHRQPRWTLDIPLSFEL